MKNKTKRYKMLKIVKKDSVYNTIWSIILIVKMFRYVKMLLEKNY